jgi:hypothetical protein
MSKRPEAKSIESIDVIQELKPPAPPEGKNGSFSAACEVVPLRKTKETLLDEGSYSTGSSTEDRRGPDRLAEDSRFDRE